MDDGEVQVDEQELGDGFHITTGPDEVAVEEELEEPDQFDKAFPKEDAEVTEDPYVDPAFEAYMFGEEASY